MTIYRVIGYPDLFVIITCNSKWPKIKYLIELIRNVDAIFRLYVEFLK